MYTTLLFYDQNRLTNLIPFDGHGTMNVYNNRAKGAQNYGSKSLPGHRPEIVLRFRGVHGAGPCLLYTSRCV